MVKNKNGEVAMPSRRRNLNKARRSNLTMETHFGTSTNRNMMSARRSNLTTAVLAVASTTPAAATSAPDFDIPGAARPETQIRLYRAKVKALEADVREKDG